MALRLIYGAETWTDYGTEVEVIYTSGLRTALGIRTNINNEIVYIESNRFPLKCRIERQQLKFWIGVKEYTNKNPNSALKYLLNTAFEITLPLNTTKI